jgi:hypothetical protein
MMPARAIVAKSPKSLREREIYNTRALGSGCAGLRSGEHRWPGKLDSACLFSKVAHCSCVNTRVTFTQRRHRGLNQASEGAGASI